jgi:hypothetical protein
MAGEGGGDCAGEEAGRGEIGGEEKAVEVGGEGAGVNAEVDAARVRQGQDNSSSRKMRGLRRTRRKFTRTLSGRAPSGFNQKVSGFNYDAYREQNNHLQTVNAQQIRATTAPANARSPLSKVKRDRSVLRASLESSAKKQRLLATKCYHHQEKAKRL